MKLKLRTNQTAQGRLRLSRIAVLATLVLAGCTATVANPGGGQRRDSRMATQEEIEESREANLLAFVEAFRPQWLRPMNSAGLRAGEVVVYLDGMRIGGPEALRGIASSFAREVRYVDGMDAIGRWGVGHEEGAIMISSALVRDALSGRARAGRSG